LIEAVRTFCNRIEDRLVTGLAVIHVSGVPDASWARDLSVGLVSRWERVLRRLERAPLATVAIASGDCSGTALDVLLTVDVRIAVRGTRLVPVAYDDATWPGMVLYRLARHAYVGPARRAALFGTPLDAVTAAQAGLVDEVVDDPDAALDAVVALTAGVAGEELAIRRQLLLDAGHTRFEDALGSHLAACDRALRRGAGV
jgi:isomerase DpgB